MAYVRPEGYTSTSGRGQGDEALTTTSTDSPNLRGKTIVSNTVPNSTTGTITIREFMGDNVNFLANDDLHLELRKGGNAYAGGSVHSNHVLVTINVDDCQYSNVQVSASHGTYLDAVEASIEAQIVVRDRLRKMAAVA
jgi:hypothetical protein